MFSFWSFTLLALYLLALRVIIPPSEASHSRLYQHQFSNGSEHLPMPRTVALSMYMGKIHYHHMPLLFESMRWNDIVTFHIINIIPAGSNYSDDVLSLHRSMGLRNVHIKVITLQEWSDRVRDRLGIHVEYTLDWSYKLCDYKPVVAYLFPELVGEEYKYWGFVDMDVIWGNISRFSHWFQGQPFVISGWWRSTGAAQFFVNEEWTKRIMLDDPLYVALLANLTYHNLDEAGIQTKAANVIEKGRHSLSHYILTISDSQNKYTLNRGKDWQDHCFLDEGDSVEWAGPIRWFRGTLQVVHGSPVFPPGRELLFYHRPLKRYHFRGDLVPSLLQDMMKYGYLLPNWVPLLSREMCLDTMQLNRTSTIESLMSYVPYKDKCVT